MPSTFQNPRNPLAAFWASAVETHLREQNTDLNIQQIRQLPMMQGAYEHLSQLKEKKRVTKPPNPAAAKEAGQASNIAQMAYLSQSFFDLAVTTASFSTIGSEKYEEYIELSCPEIGGQILNIKSDTNHDKTTRSNHSVQY